MSIIGTGALNTVKAAKVTCVTTDAYWKKRNGGKVVVYAGKPLYNLYKAQPANWKGEPRPLHATVPCQAADVWCLNAGSVPRNHCVTITDQSSAGIQLNLPNEPDFLGEWRYLLLHICVPMDLRT